MAEKQEDQYSRHTRIERQRSSEGAYLQDQAEEHATGHQTPETSSTSYNSRRYSPRYAYQSARNMIPKSRSLSHTPLVEKVTNSWRGSKLPDYNGLEKALEQSSLELRFCDPDEEGSCPYMARSLAQSRRFRRYGILLTAILLLAGFLLLGRGRVPFLSDEDLKIEQSFQTEYLNGTYGIMQAGDFDGVRIRDLEPSLLPGGRSDAKGERRLIFVGDIHGCRDELKELLHVVGFNPKTDHLIATGDVVSKGPKNIGVLNDLMDMNADSVRGNHEDRLIEVAKKELLWPNHVETEETSSKGYAKDSALVKKFKPRHLDYLKDMPLVLRIPVLPQTKSVLGQKKKKKDKNLIQQEILVVHAGLVPNVPLSRQDPFYVMNMRTIESETHAPSAVRGPHGGKDEVYKPWIDLWNWYNNRVFYGRSLKGFFQIIIPGEVEQGWLSEAYRAWKGKAQPQIVVYGHDSKSGLQIHRWTKGLDSACVAGGELSAMVLSADGSTVVKSVKCQDYRA